MFSVRNGATAHPDYKAMIANGVKVIDVRTPEEFNSGHVQGSINIPLDNIGDKLNQIKSFNSPIIAVCRSGARSSVATGILTGAGIEAYNAGGWTDLNAHLQ